MCDFKVGERVAYVGGDIPGLKKSYIEVGSEHTIEWVGLSHGYVAVKIPSHRKLIVASSFRRIQRRNLTEWLSQSVGNTDKLDKKKVRVK